MSSMTKEEREATKAKVLECAAEDEGAPLMTERDETESVGGDSTATRRKRNRLSFLGGRPASITIDIPKEESPHFQRATTYDSTVKKINEAIEKGKDPELVVAGSSGSYWVFLGDGTKAGIFKPKSEEPYGPANPKWAKWFHRVLCPCCFGRSCLLLNTGYVSEAGAFAMDCLLDLQVVPPTSIIRLSAKTFNYNAIEKRLPKRPTKIGSMQLLVECNGDGKSLNVDSLNTTQKVELLDQFQRLVILDYMTRNTDRGLDNWLTYIDGDTVRIHAIDNGLAFPFKHPDNWRTYPPSWASHTLGKKPFTKAIRRHVLRQIKSTTWLANCERRLREIMSLDEIFTESRFQGQISVVRGQRRNLIKCIEREASTPEELFAMHPLYIVKKSNGEVGWKTHLPCFRCC
eukprot:TRINITY_DN5207_c0_g1_i1.p1 TRINITY_DN5207_c0_g1~~TRINITY_DN5207_c0_g1_i1.p1  ORF type:complete len:455 (+),score=101.11 TRINITY_DN5207_c0_g1_i1:160-1365(+)